MRTLDPKIIREDYLAGVIDVRTTWDAVLATGLSYDGKKLVAEYSFLAAAILLEGYISDLFTAYINQNDARFKTELINKMKIDTSDLHAKAATSFAAILIQGRLTQSEIRKIIDPRDFNITFVTTAEMKAAAGRWLATGYKNRFTSITGPQAAVMECIKAMRNFLAHRSTSARDTMQTALAKSNLPASLKRGGHEIHDVGSYLTAQSGGSTRIAQYLTYLESIGTVLCP
jgi:hypothetical protein